MKKKYTIGIIFVIGTALILVNILPFTTHLNITYTGYMLTYDEDVIPDFEEPAEAEQITVSFDGIYIRYLWKPDTFKGVMTVEGFEYRIKENTKDYWLRYETDEVQFTVNRMEEKKMNCGPIMEYRNGNECLNWIRADFSKNDSFIYLPVNSKGQDKMVYGTHRCIVASAASAEEAHELFMKEVWQLWQLLGEQQTN